MKTEANEPIAPYLNTENMFDTPGLTKREYFAAMALQGFLSSYAGATADPKKEHVSAKSVEYADALIKALNEAK